MEFKLDGYATNPPENHSERARTSTGVQVSNFYKSSTVIFRNFWLYLSPYTNPCKYSVCKSGQLHDCKIQRSTKNIIELLKYLAWAICDEPNTNFTAFDSHLLVHYKFSENYGVKGFIVMF